MTLVVDASVASKWSIAEPDSPDARLLNRLRGTVWQARAVPLSAVP
jgi:hypothetical protein